MMLQLGYDYATCVKNSEKVSWSLDEILPEGTELDFTRPFLPEPLALSSRVQGLDDDGRRILNQITGNAYLNLFAFVEEYIIATTIQHATAELFGDRDAIRALCRFADEEVKHQELFKRYREAFNRGVGYEAGVLGNAVEVAGIIMGKSPMGILFVTLHIELMTQQHYVDCVQNNQGIDPLFAKLLKSHWLEESQHAKIDALELGKLTAMATPPMIEAAFKDYFEILEAFDGLLGQQADMDVTSLEAALNTTLDEATRAEVRLWQQRAYRVTFLVYGLTNPTWAKIQAQLSEAGAAEAKQIAERFREGV